jgi:hypothetical protein
LQAQRPHPSQPHTHTYHLTFSSYEYLKCIRHTQDHRRFYCPPRYRNYARCVCVYVCVCVSERERESMYVCVRDVCVCVCVCVYVYVCATYAKEYVSVCARALPVLARAHTHRPFCPVRQTGSKPLLTAYL